MDIERGPALVGRGATFNGPSTRRWTSCVQCDHPPRADRACETRRCSKSASCHDRLRATPRCISAPQSSRAAAGNASFAIDRRRCAASLPIEAGRVAKVELLLAEGKEIPHIQQQGSKANPYNRPHHTESFWSDDHVAVDFTIAGQNHNHVVNDTFVPSFSLSSVSSSSNMRVPSLA